MKLKKSEKANLESKRSIFLLSGFVIALSFVLLAFEWGTNVTRIGDLGIIEDPVPEDDYSEIIRIEKPKPKLEKVVLTPFINPVDDLIEVDDILETFDPEANEDTKITIIDIPDEPNGEEIIYVAEIMPYFPGTKSKAESEAAIQSFIRKNVKYPEIAKSNEVQGMVYISFVINKKGKVTLVELRRGVDPSLDQEAIRVVESLPIFSPGEQNGRPVSVGMTVPINFVLR